MAGKIDGNAVVSSSNEEYLKDKRPACKYGAACYQKNRAHQDKFKHPPKPLDDDKVEPLTESRKKRGGSRSPVKGHVKESGETEKSPKRLKRNDTDSPGKDKNKGEGGFEEGTKYINNLERNSALNNESDSVSTAESSRNNIDEEPEIPPSPVDVRENIKQKFLFEMPEDFYSFWEFCKSLNPKSPPLAFKDFGLELVGPYDVLSGKLKVSGCKRKQSLFLLHWRYYYDPPEFQTVLKGDEKRQFHIGYFRDEPHSLPVFLASNAAAKDGVFKQVAENIFGAVAAYLIDLKKTGNPFLHSKIPKYQKSLEEWAKVHGYTLETKTQAMKQRDRKSVTKTFHGLGLVVPVERKTEVGYRELIETDAKLKRILDEIINSSSAAEKDVALDKLQPIITAANIANDECDFGTSVELGLDLFSFGGADLEKSALQLLSTGYSLLGRKEFAQIAKVHLSNRRKDGLLSSFD